MDQKCDDRCSRERKVFGESATRRCVERLARAGKSGTRYWMLGDRKRKITAFTAKHLSEQYGLSPRWAQAVAIRY